MSSSPQKPKVYEAKRLEPGQAIAIDGRGDDPAWQSAKVLTDFSFPWSGRTPPATEFRALWDERRLYFLFDVADDDVVLGDGADAKEKVIGSDRVEIFFSTGPELNPYYALEIDPRGEVLDYEARYHRRMNWAWSCEGLTVGASRTDSGYLVEGSIPRSTLEKLGCLHQDEDGWRLRAGLYRAEFRHDPAGGPVIEDWMSWVDPQVPAPDFHVPTSFGEIRLVE
jgi:hypothetical protein